MQETCNNCFGLKKHSTTLLQAKKGKHECRNVTAMCCCYLCLPEDGSCYVFSTRNNCCKFLAFYGVITQSVIQSLLQPVPLTHLFHSNIFYIFEGINNNNNKKFRAAETVCSKNSVSTDHSIY